MDTRIQLIGDEYTWPGAQLGCPYCPWLTDHVESRSRNLWGRVVISMIWHLEDHLVPLASVRQGDLFSIDGGDTWRSDWVNIDPSTMPGKVLVVRRGEGS